jgi:hypothetical protein
MPEAASRLRGDEQIRPGSGSWCRQPPRARTCARPRRPTGPMSRPSPVESSGRSSSSGPRGAPRRSQRRSDAPEAAPRKVAQLRSPCTDPGIGTVTAQPPCDHLERLALEHPQDGLLLARRRHAPLPAGAPSLTRYRAGFQRDVRDVAAPPLRQRTTRIGGGDMRRRRDDRCGRCLRRRSAPHRRPGTAQARPPVPDASPSGA